MIAVAYPEGVLGGSFSVLFNKMQYYIIIIRKVFVCKLPKISYENNLFAI